MTGKKAVFEIPYNLRTISPRSLIALRVRSASGAQHPARAMPLLQDACTESHFSTLKNELIRDQAHATRDAARMAIVSCIEGFYNRKWPHQTLGYRTPTAVDDEAMSA